MSTEDGNSSGVAYIRFGIQGDEEVIATTSKQHQPENGQNDTGRTREQRKNDEEVKLRRLLRFHRYSPIKIKGGKAHFHVVYCIIMLMQAVKIGLITWQMVKFASDRATFSSVVNRGHLTLRHLLLNKWDSRQMISCDKHLGYSGSITLYDCSCISCIGYETPPYPPSRGAFAVYTTDSLMTDLNYAVEGYFNVENNGIGFYFLTNQSGIRDKMSGRMRYFDFSGFHPNSNYQDFSVRETEFSVDDVGLTYEIDPITNKTTYKYNITEKFEYLNLTEPAKRLLSLNLDFSLHSVRVYEDLKKALCLHIKGTVKFEDDNNDGQMVVDLVTSSSSILCSQIYQHTSIPDVDLATGYHPLGNAVMIFSVMSSLISLASLILGIYLIVRTKRFMKDYFREFYDVGTTEDDPKDLTPREYSKMAGILIWDVIVISTDVCNFYGVFTLTFGSWASHQDTLLSELDMTAVFLCAGGLLSWFHILKIFKMQENFQVLFKTLRNAFFAMTSYLFCIAVLFTGFLLCGYVMLGPYHVKFETVSATIETLFSVSNGDEIFATLANVEYDKTGNNEFVWWFSRIYIYLYVAVFTIVVLNILIAIFVNAYDAIKVERRDTKEKRRFSPLEIALDELFTKSGDLSKTQLRSACYDLFEKDDQSLSIEEERVKTELRKSWRLTKDDKSSKLVKLKETTLRVFIEEGNDDSNKCYFKSVVIYFWFSDFE